MKHTFDFITLVVVVFGLLNWACSSAGEKTDKQNTSEQAPAQPQGAPAELTSISVEAMRDLWTNCDALDIIFYNNNFSLSQNDRTAIQNTLGFFLPTEVSRDRSCKPIGRVTFLVQGEIRQEADIYLSPNCNYLIWMKDNKPVHINPMSAQGVAFFQGIIQKAEGMQ